MATKEQSFTFETMAVVLCCMLKSGITLGNQHYEMMSKLDGKAKDAKGRTLLSWASIAGSRKLVEFLLAAAVFEVEVQDKAGRTPFMEAVSRGHKEVVDTLLRTGCIDVNRKDRSGDTPLTTAILHGHHDIAARLLRTSTIDVNRVT